VRLGPKTGCGYALGGQLQQFVKDAVPYSIGRPRGLGPRGKALSSAAISCSRSDNSPAAAFCAACSALDALGIASTEAARVRNASATWRGVALCASDIACSTSPPLLRPDGNSLWPNGE